MTDVNESSKMPGASFVAGDDIGRKNRQEKVANGDKENSPDLAVANVVQEKKAETDEDEENGIPIAKEYNQEALKRNSRVFLFGFFIIGVIVIVAVVSIVVTRLFKKEQSLASTTTTIAPTTYRESLGIQEVIEDLIQGDQLSDPNSAESKALDWIINEDPAGLLSGSARLIQRYILAYLYYHTSKEGPWFSCNKPEGSQRDICTFQDFVIDRYQQKRASRWLSGAKECDWAGISCESGNVQAIELRGQNLTGTLPSMIAKLPSLDYLDFEHNDLSGTLVSEIAAMPAMKYLYLGHNSFTGTMPKEWFDLKDMEHFVISENAVVGGFPSEFAKVSSLTYLNLANNKFSGTIPTEIFQLEKLNRLNVGGNELVGSIPSEIGLLSNTLYSLRLSKNALNGTLPIEMGKLREISSLYVENTQLSGTLPEWLWDFPEARYLKFESSKFNGTISTKIGQLDQLKFFEIANNAFSGSIPTEMGKLNSLMRATFQNNNFTGDVPEQICTLKGPNKLIEIAADCSPLDSTGVPAMVCPAGCCTECCSRETNVCAQTGIGN